MNTSCNFTLEPGTCPSSSTFEITELGKKDSKWRLEIRASDLALYEGAETQPYVILREHFRKDGVLMEHFRAMSITVPRKLTFKLTPEATRAVEDWIGKPLLASVHLKRRYGWVLPIAVLWAIASVPLPADPQSGIAAKPLDVLGLGLALTLVICWAFAKWRPHPTLFLVDSVWFLCLAGTLVSDVLQGRSSGWLILVFFLVWSAFSGFRHFIRFRGISITADHSRA